MFKKTVLAKFEWVGLPKGLTELFVEKLIYESTSENFAVVETPDGEEFWGYYSVLERDTLYGKPLSINVTPYNRGTFATSDFILFNEFNYNITNISTYVSCYSSMIQQINAALSQHITASQLIATIYARSMEEKNELEKIFKCYKGIKILRRAMDGLDVNENVDFINFEIPSRLEELERVKHELERDLFLRAGINYGIDKTHISMSNVKNSEQPVDLVNAFELKKREDFCERYNAKRGATLGVKLRQIVNTLTNREIESNGINNAGIEDASV